MEENMLSQKEMEIIYQIRNAIAHNGRLPSIRELKKVMGYKSPRSIAVLLEQLERKGFLGRRPEGDRVLLKDLEDAQGNARTIDVPLVGTVACGTPILADQNIEAMIPVSTRLARGQFKYFMLRAKGDSMNRKGINDGDFLLVRQQPSANNGDDVVALIDDEATVKEIQISEDAIVLKPRSSNPKYQPIVLHNDFQIQGVVIKSIPKEAIHG
jgi:repressor LexA